MNAMHVETLILGEKTRCYAIKYFLMQKVRYDTMAHDTWIKLTRGKIQSYW